MIITRQQAKALVFDLFRAKKQAVSLELIDIIDFHLTRQTHHFYANGKLLFTLDQVVRAILAGELDNESIPPVEAGPRIIMTDKPLGWIQLPRKLIEGRL